MSKSRRAPRFGKRDENEEQFVAEARQTGIWLSEHLPETFGADRIFIDGKMGLLEIKMPGKENDLTAAEKNMRALCIRHGVPYVIASDAVSFTRQIGRSE